MKFAVPYTFVVRPSSAWRIGIPRKGHWVILFLIGLAFQPFGSFASLALFLASCSLMVYLHPVRGRHLANGWILLLYFALVGLLLKLFQPVNPMLFLLYAAYWALGVLTYTSLANRIGDSSRKDILILINWILALDLAINLPPCLIELVRDGIGDWVTGLSGLILQQSASQNRTNSVRAVALAVLALVNYRQQRNGLSLLSLGFNSSVLILATSMTTIMSAFGALGAVVVLRRINLRTLVFGAALVGMVLVANIINQHFLKTESMFDLISQLNTRWLPKLDMYRQYSIELIERKPWLLLLGFGFGNFMNRFSILANYANYSMFPGKAFISSLLESPFTKTYLVDYYGLGRQDVGSSILITPWSGFLSIVTEWGLIGILLGALCAWPMLRSLWVSRQASLRGPGRFLLLFLVFNLGFDCYMDYPELMVPFFIITLLMVNVYREDGKVRPKAQA